MTPTQTTTCPKCNAAVEPGAKFCPSCGSSVSGIFSGGGSPLDGTAIVMAEDTDTLFPILQEATLGDYDIYGELGRGGMAAVYLALDLALNRKVAIKTMLPELVSREGMVARFKREAQTAAGLSHPHIIQIFSVKETSRLVYFVMKYIEGRALESVMHERGALDVDLTRAILAQAGGALAFAHRKGVIHRDVKPANIMLEEDGWAIVTDFGIAKVQEATNLTGTGTAIGTPHYMSPEQFHNKNVTGASDQYSLGIVAYEMLSGRKPFDGGTYAEILTQHLFDPPPDIRQLRPDVPENVAQAIIRMMAKDAKDRFADLDAAIAAFGMPTQSEVGTVRSQMISLAKSGPARQVRMSVPISPIPQGKRPTPRSAKTTIEPTHAARPTPASAQSQKKKSKALVYVASAVVGVAAIVGIVIGTVKLTQGPAATPQNTVAPQQKTASPVAPPQGAATNAAGVPDTSAQVPAITKPDVKPPAAERPADKTAKAKPEKPKTQVADAGTKKAPDVAKPNKPAVTPAVTQQSGSAPTNAAPTNPQPVQQQQPAPQPAAPAAPPGPGTVRIGTPTENAYLYVNGVIQGKPLARLPEEVSVPAGQVHLTIKADKCTPWDSTFAVASGESHTVGRRPLVCSP